jgi:hypothetical protein
VDTAGMAPLKLRSDEIDVTSTRVALVATAPSRQRKYQPLLLHVWRVVDPSTNVVMLVGRFDYLNDKESGWLLMLLRLV